MDDMKKVLVEAARTAMQNAYAPYSKFAVGAAVMGGSGKVYTGANVENVSYGLSICAERAAVFNAVSSGEREIRAVAIATSADEIAFPCGACRQVLMEFAPKEGEMAVYLASGQKIEEHSLSSLLPNVFKLESSGD